MRGATAQFSCTRTMPCNNIPVVLPGWFPKTVIIIRSFTTVTGGALPASGQELCMLRLCASMLACLALIAQERQLGQGVNFCSKEKEAALGAAMAQDVRRSTMMI